MEKKRGKFITFEGIEGGGKTTQIKIFCEFLRKQGIEFVQSKEPGGTRIGSAIRKVLLNAEHTEMVPACEALLYLADRMQHLEEFVKPHLNRGVWVISDRYHDSTSAYQGAARKLAADRLDRIFELAGGGLKPDATVLLDLDPKRGLNRACRRNQELGLTVSEGRFEAEALVFHEQVRAAFLALAEREPARFVTVNAERDVPEIAADIRGRMKARWEDCFV